jgi:hypothetical protein
MRKNDKILNFQYEQHGAANNSQGGQLWFSSQDGRDLANRGEMSRSASGLDVLQEE